MPPLPPALARLEALLKAGNGEFVAGTALCRGIGIPMESLASFVAALRRHRPDLAIEGRRGRGYRLVVPVTSPPQPSPTTPDTSKPAPAAVQATARCDPLDPFMPPLAEIVRDIALVSGETIDATVARLVAYGVEVHRDLVMSGENALALSSPRAERQPGRCNNTDRQQRLVTPVRTDTRHSPSDRHV